MIRPRDDEVVYVESAGRLHFGVLDLRGALGRWFGGIGTPAPAPSVLVSAQPADTLTVDGEDAARAEAFARQFLERVGIRGGAYVRVHRALPSHVGLGSGTQLALAVARALAEVHGLSIGTSDLARAVGRGGRSAIGTWTFDRGGLIVEGGRRRDRQSAEDIAPMLVRLPLPATWRCIVAIPNAAPGVSGDAEASLLTALAPPPQCEIEHVAHLVLLALLPALAEGDLPAFGAALTGIQAMNGRWFAPAQGGIFASGPSGELVQHLSEFGAVGVGQSSWGPAVYGIVDGADAGARLAERVRDVLGGRGQVFEGPFRNSGASVWRGPTTR